MTKVFCRFMRVMRERENSCGAFQALLKIRPVAKSDRGKLLVRGLNGRGADFFRSHDRRHLEDIVSRNGP